MRTFPDFPLFVLSSMRSALSRTRATNCIWELTYRCNAKCGFCPYWKRASTEHTELGLDEIKAGLRTLYRSGCRFINFSGGEPTLRRDLEDIVACASAQGFWTSLVSNGSLLTREKIQGLKEAGLDNLFVSLDFIDPQDHDRLRNRAGLHAKAIDALAHLGELFTTGHRTAGMMCVISKFNAGELEELVALSRRLGVYIVFQLYHDKKTGDASFTPHETTELADTLCELRRRNRHLISSKSYLTRMRGFKDGHSLRCFAGDKYFSIDPAGFFHPCIDMPSAGHILTDDLAMLRSPRARESVSACPGCWYCFRGEADVSFSVTGCLEKIAKHGRVFVHNIVK
jgi:MoaA/NifB/PqqE/SkfB family radical SAM enzyme